MSAFTVGLLAWAVLALPPLRTWLEASLLTHMLVQLPILVAAGFMIGTGTRRSLQRPLALYNMYGIPGALLAVLTLLFWLLPRSLDAALLAGTWEIAKFVSLPLLAGMPLALSWPHLGVIGRAFVGANLAAMLAAMGGLYLASPVRLCTNYLLSEQRLLGYVALGLGGVLGIICLIYAVTAGGRASFENTENCP